MSVKYHLTGGQMFGVVACALSCGLNGALFVVSLAEHREVPAIGAGLATVAMILALTALLRLGKAKARTA